MIKNILKYICIFNILACCFCLCVHADTYSYYAYTGTNCIQLFNCTDSNGIRTFHSRYAEADVRFVIIDDGNYYRWVAFSDYAQSYMFYFGLRSNCTASASGTVSTFDGVNYAVGEYSNNKGMGTYTFLTDIPVYEKISGKTYLETAYYYTYGEGSEVLPDPIVWGELRDVQYNTRIAGQGTAVLQNIDVISWDTALDTHGNDISECTVEVQAIPGSYTGSTFQELLNKKLNDFDITGKQPVTIGSVPASQGSFTASWSAVIDRLVFNYDMLWTHLNQSDAYEKYGWYYKIRLVDPDGNPLNWQSVYTPLASSASASETVINSTSYSMNIYQSYEELTQINNQMSITVTFQDTTYTIQNPDDGIEPSEPLDYFDILKQLLNGIIQIVGNIQQLPQRLGEKVQELITPPQEYDNSIAEEYNGMIEEYLQEEQPTIYDFLDGVEELHQYVPHMLPGDEGIHTCILTWEDVTIDMTAFNAGNVTFVQGGTYNLTDAFLDILHAYGMTYEKYEFLVSAVIYLWLCVFIWHKFVDFLRN